jgi:hypothetical protein
LELVTFRPPEEQGAASINDLSLNTAAARRRASQTFIHICNEIPDALLPHLESILNMIGQIYAQGLLLEEEKANLIEALVAVRYVHLPSHFPQSVTSSHPVPSPLALRAHLANQSNAFRNLAKQEAFVLAVLKTPLEVPRTIRPASTSRHFY